MRKTKSAFPAPLDALPVVANRIGVLHALKADKSILMTILAIAEPVVMTMGNRQFARPAQEDVLNAVNRLITVSNAFLLSEEKEPRYVTAEMGTSM